MFLGKINKMGGGKATALTTIAFNKFDYFLFN